MHMEHVLKLQNNDKSYKSQTNTISFVKSSILILSIQFKKINALFSKNKYKVVEKVIVKNNWKVIVGDTLLKNEWMIAVDGTFCKMFVAITELITEVRVLDTISDQKTSFGHFFRWFSFNTSLWIPSLASLGFDFIFSIL